MTEIELHRPTNDLSVQMDYARAVQSASMLPDNYRNKPADIMLAVGLGQSMGLSPAESLYRIHVIKGKPTASAELIASNVRSAGHILRIKVTENPPSATCTIFRTDDPDEPTTITRDMDWAKRMGLLSSDNYTKQPATMLANRAITACARLACPEALYGVAYTSDEMGDLPSPEPRPGLGAVLAGPQISDPEAAPATSEQSSPPLSSGSESPLLNTSSKLAKTMYAAIDEAGITDNERLSWLSSVIGREISTSKEMTDADARLVLNSLAAATEVIEAEVVES